MLARRKVLTAYTVPPDREKGRADLPAPSFRIGLVLARGFDPKLYSGSLVFDLGLLFQTGWRNLSVQQFGHVFKQTRVGKNIKHPTATILTARASPGEAAPAG